jgi:metabolite-proton symporter
MSASVHEPPPPPSPTVIRSAAQRGTRRAATAGLIGTTIEWYDFFAYGTAAALVFAPQFFPEVSSLAGTLAVLATFAVGFVARPVGGAVMGHFGDRFGRKRMLVTSLVMMGAATFCIGLLPGYATIGAAAPVLLVILRLVQGLGVGGEWGGAVLMSVEHAPSGRRAFYGSFPQMGLPAGVGLATVAFLVLRLLLDERQFAAWGWRIPFLLSAVLVAFGLVVRARLEESPEFVSVRQEGRVSRGPAVEVVRRRPAGLLIAAGVSVSGSALGNILLVYTLAHATKELGLATSTMLWIIVVVSLVWTLLIPVSAALADRVGRRRLLLAGVSLGAVWGFPYFWLVDTGSAGGVLLAMVVAGSAIGVASGPHAAFVAEAFPARLRYSGASIAYAIGGVAGGAIAPIVATSLYAGTGSTALISAYVVGVCALSAGCTLALRSPAAPDEPELAG